MSAFKLINFLFNFWFWLISFEPFAYPELHMQRPHVFEINLHILPL